MTTNITSTIERFLVDQIMMGDKGTKIDPETSLINSGVIDSLSMLRLINFLEEEFGIVVEDEEVVPDNFDTLKIMESFVAEKLNHQ
jgi:acyl carrier protein